MTLGIGPPSLCAFCPSASASAAHHSPLPCYIPPSHRSLSFLHSPPGSGVLPTQTESNTHLSRFPTSVFPLLSE
ncbi:hypothetical protein BT69DRAFT_1127639 [Atractiella rhizophila]|nr:hypothetical protein BT69DRAFT_1127639 [Atractiella rhizophila]